MESYADRISKFQDMVSTTNDHIKSVEEAATRFKESNDPIGLGLEVTGATAGGVSSVASAVLGIQEFKDYSNMYKGLSSKLSGIRNRLNNQVSNAQNTIGSGRDGSLVNNAGAGAADQDSSANTQVSSKAPDVDAGINDRINNIENQPFPTQEANDINNAINQKVNSELGSNGKSILNSAVSKAGRNQDVSNISSMADGDSKVAAQKDFLSFKNKVANDAITRNRTGKTQASGYDADGNATGDLPTPQASGASNALQTQATTAPNPVGTNNVANLAADANQPSAIANAAGDTVTQAAADTQAAASGIIAQGRAALSNLLPGMVPSRTGTQVAGMRIGAGNANDVSAQANAGARVQQAAADDASNRLAAGRNPNGQPPAGDGTGVGNDGNPTGANTGAQAADGSDVSDTINAVRNTATDAIGDGIGEGLDELSGFAGPAAPIVGLVGGLITLGTTIAGLFHHKPPPTKEAPPPPPTSSIGGSMRDTVSGYGAGIF